MISPLKNDGAVRNAKWFEWRGNGSIPQILAKEPRQTFWRMLQTFSISRVVIAIVLLAYVSINPKNSFWATEQYLSLQACLVYFLLSILFTISTLYYRRRLLLQLLSQTLIDIIVMSILYITAGGAKSGLAILYLFTLAGSAILAPLLLAFFFVSVVTLVLLGESIYQIMHTVPEASLSQSGLYGAAFFAAVFFINRLAVKLIQEEALALRHGRDLRIQEAINRLVLADMGDGILVIRRDGTILTANPAAESMLSLTLHHDKHDMLTAIPALSPVADAFFSWLAISATQAMTKETSSTFIMIKPSDDHLVQPAIKSIGRRKELALHLKVRFATVADAGLLDMGTHEERTIVFLQDVTEIENQAQQLKLASMGRLTASIAHEVRNPLSAISYAAALMREEVVAPSQMQLLKIVGDNVTRLNQMIEDILKLSRKAQSYTEPLLLDPFFVDVLDEFRRTNGVRKTLIQVDQMTQISVWFDPLHLREVILNLLSNAMRYASGVDGSIRIRAVFGSASRLELHVQDDGVSMLPEVRAHLFEPFYTTSSKGTGLGLYLARELCLNNGAMLDYEYRTDDELDKVMGRFVITLALADPL